jgi:Response regulator containing a CheY-like receiver domain and an HTH DNA-binding domain
MVRLLVVDANRADRRLIRHQLNGVDGVTVVAESASYADAVRMARPEIVDLVLLDLQPQRPDGFAAIRAITSGDASVPVLVLSDHSDREHVTNALDCGAIGYLVRRHDLPNLAPAIRTAAKGHAVISSRVISKVVREFVRRGQRLRADGVGPAGETVLSPAELAVVAHLSGGFTTNEEIATQLSISVNTVRAQIAQSLRKTGTANRTALALWGLRNGLDRRIAAGGKPAA